MKKYKLYFKIQNMDAKKILRKILLLAKKLFNKIVVKIKKTKSNLYIMKYYLLRFFFKFRRSDFKAIRAFRILEKLFLTGNFDSSVTYGKKFIENFPRDVDSGSQSKLIVSLSERIINFEEYKRKIDFFDNRSSAKEGRSRLKIAVFSAISKNYDPVNLPGYIDKRFEYFLFTDVPVVDTKIWQVRPMAYVNADPVRSARFIKTHPHTLLEGFDIAIWIDSNITILDDIYDIIDRFLKSGMMVAGIPHPIRKSFFEECEACAFCQKDDPGVIEAHRKKYLLNKFSNNDLIESNFMIFDIRKKRTSRFLDLWWKEIDSGSRRDQLSINYALSLSRLGWHRITRFPDSVRNHKKFAIVPHEKGGIFQNKLLDFFKGSEIDPYAGNSYRCIREERIKEQRRRKVDIVVCVHNALEYVKQCFRSVVENRESNHHIVVVDDGSADETKMYLEHFSLITKNCSLIRNEVALGYLSAANAGLKASTGELVILLNSDTLVTKNWIEKLCDAAFSRDEIGIVGPLSNAASWQSVPDYKNKQNQTAINKLPPGIGHDTLNKYCEEWTVGDTLPSVPLAHGFCFGIKRSLIDKIGYFDDKTFADGYGEENDYCFRATDAGFEIVIATHTYIFHEKSKSYEEKKRISLMKSSLNKFRDKYGNERVRRACLTMEKNPFLVKFRRMSLGLYNDPNNKNSEDHLKSARVETF